MRQVKIEYENFERDENKALVAEIVLAYAWLFPVWLRTLTVSVYDRHVDSETMDAWSSGNPKYGTVHIGIKTKFFDKPARWQHSTVLHELLHIAHMRVWEFLNDRLLGPVKERNEDLHAFLDEDISERIEEFIEHMAQEIVDITFDFSESAKPGDSADAKTWRPEEPHRSDALPMHKPLAMVGHRRRTETPHD